MRRFAPLLFLGASSLFAANQSREELLKNPKFAEAKAPLFETLTPESLREAACSNFNVAGPYAEWVLLGMVATRVPGKLLWDPAKMEFTNNREANKYVRPVFRKGWEITSLT
jgi:hypothetical protein